MRGNRRDPQMPPPRRIVAHGFSEKPANLTKIEFFVQIDQDVNTVS
jgi:hypothetical protein